MFLAFFPWKWADSYGILLRSKGCLNYSFIHTCKYGVAKKHASIYSSSTNMTVFVTVQMYNTMCLLHTFIIKKHMWYTTRLHHESKDNINSILTHARVLPMHVCCLDSWDERVTPAMSNEDIPSHTISARITSRPRRHARPMGHGLPPIQPNYLTVCFITDPHIISPASQSKLNVIVIVTVILDLRSRQWPSVR